MGKADTDLLRKILRLPHLHDLSEPSTHRRFHGRFKIQRNVSRLANRLNVRGKHAENFAVADQGRSNSVNCPIAAGGDDHFASLRLPRPHRAIPAVPRHQICTQCRATERTPRFALQSGPDSDRRGDLELQSCFSHHRVMIRNATTLDNERLSL